MSIAQGGSNGQGVVTGTPKAADNTGRDWGQGVGLGAATAGAVIGSILTWGAASPALIAGDAAAIGATATNDAIQDQQQAKDQQRQLQSNLDAHQAQMGSGAAVKAAAQPMPGAHVAPAPVNPNLGTQLGGFKPVEQTPGAVNMDAMNFTGQEATPLAAPSGQGMIGASDRRVKTNIAPGSSAASAFLDAVRARGAWPKGVKDPRT